MVERLCDESRRMTTVAAAHRGIQAPTRPVLLPVTVPEPATVVAAGCAYADPIWDRRPCRAGPQPGG